jgi:transcriptional regulator with XRE-family HTH domain
MGQEQSLPDHLARAVRGARKVEGISQSELARRAGVSPSVISRIEAGIVRRPDDRTSHRVATALARSARALLYLQEGQTSFGIHGLDESIPAVRQAREELDRELEKDIVDDAAVKEKWEALLPDAVLEWFISTRFTDELDVQTRDSDAPWALQEFVHCWSQLTEERKELVLGFLKDQAWLSWHDRELDKPVPDLFSRPQGSGE